LSRHSRDKRAADVAQDSLGMGVKILEVAEGIAEEIDGIIPVVVMGH
jgi:hypothetical protein